MPPGSPSWILDDPGLFRCTLGPVKPMDKISKPIRTAVVVIVAIGFAGTVLLAQVDLDTLCQAAEQGDAEAQYSLGYRYATGVAVSQDNAAASRWLRLAAEQGHAQAQQFLERIFPENRHVSQDDAVTVLPAAQNLPQGNPMTESIY